MAVLSTNEEIASRFAPYLGELHELFGLHGVPFGSPADLPVLVERLDSGGFFAEDVSSILRSIILREGGSVPQTELLEVLALAAAGPNLDPTIPEVQPAFRRLLSFVGTIARRPWNVPPGESTAAPTPDGQAAPEDQPAPAHSEPPPVQSVDAPAKAVEVPQSKGLPPGFRPFAPRPHVEELEPALMDGIPPPKPHSGRNPSWPLWIASACAIAAVLLLVLFDRAHAPEPVLTTAPNPTTAATAPNPAAPPIYAQPVKPSASVPVPAGRRAASAAPVTTTRPAKPLVAEPARSAPSSSVAMTTPTRTAAPQPTVSTRPAEATSSSPTMQSARNVPASAPTTTATTSVAPSTVAPLRRPAIALPREGSRMAPGGYFQVSPAAMAAHLVRSTEPGLPMLARVAHVQGDVVLQAMISSDGEVLSTHAVSGHHLLRGAAASAVKQWHYRPFLVNGRPVNVATTVTVDFREQH